MTRTLPMPSQERFQPLRSGLLNIFRYDSEEFWFEDGHLLLRGNNGTGKSRVLALQLPFLFDGEVAPHRLEPDGDPAKRIEWNLLMGKHQDRLGYTWLELGRLDNEDAEDPTPVFVTIGCALRAAAGRGLTDKWFFVTNQRVGEELSLVAPGGYARTRRELKEAIGERGQVLSTAQSYRDAVDRALFGLGQHRYQALVNLLIQLRQPQLSRQLDERKLSDAFSEALPPMTEHVVRDISEALRGLENDRMELVGYEESCEAVDVFLRDYRSYMQVAARRRADAVRSAQAQLNAITRDLKGTRAEHDQTQAALLAAQERQQELDLAEEKAVATRDTLADSPQMQDARTLERARHLAKQRLQEAERAQTDLALARDTVHRQQQCTTEIHSKVQVVAGRCDTSQQTLTMQAARADMQAAHEMLLTQLTPRQRVLEIGTLETTRKGAEGRVQDRLRGIAHVKRLSDDVKGKKQAFLVAQNNRQARSEDLAEANEELGTCHTALDQQTGRLVDAYECWSRNTRELSVPSVTDMEPEIRAWSERAEGISPIAQAADQALGEALGILAAERAGWQQRHDEATHVLEVLSTEREQLEQGEVRIPPEPYTRDPGARAQRLGAPLWRLVDFAADTDPVAQAGLEAALEASGLLDAWVMPDGALLDPHTHDTLFDVGPQEEEGQRTCPTLEKWLVPCIDADDAQAAAVSHHAVQAVLASIGGCAEAGDAWVDADGRWHLGVLQGAFKKQAPEYVGHAAREETRRRRLREIADAMAAHEASLAGIAEALEHLLGRATSAKQERKAAPLGEAVAQAAMAVATAGRQVTRCRDRLVAAERQENSCQFAYERIVDERNTAADDLGILAWVDKLSSLTEEVREYRQQWAEFLGVLELWALRCKELEREEQALQRAIAAQDRSADVAEEAARAMATAVAERDALEASIGAAVEDVLARLEEAKARMHQARAAREANRNEAVRLQVATEKAKERTAHLREVQGEARERRETAAQTLHAFLSTRSLPVAAPALGAIHIDDWTTTKALDVAREIFTRLDNVETSDATWLRRQKTAHAKFQGLVQSLNARGYQPSGTLEHELFVVTVPFRGVACTVAEVLEAMADEVDQRKAILDAREREIIENHLIGEVALHLHDLLRRAEEWVAQMNQELASRPMSTGMTLRFTWTASEDDTPGLKESRARLMRTGATWSDADRELLGAFLHERIEAERAANSGGTWLEHLTRALDYRRWHRFSIERQQEGTWRRLTRRTHGTGSGGEKAIALTVPQFAAAAAHYRTALPYAPRPILLDEAFVGVDSDMRSKCMGLLSAFDLDFIMTSEREWGCYKTLPGLAIYQLTARPGVDAIGLTRWVWNGRQRNRSDHTLHAVPAAP